MTAVVLQRDHDIGQRLKRHFLSFITVAYGPVLAEKTAQVAMGKKDCS
jgi:hypothetical protein